MRNLIIILLFISFAGLPQAHADGFRSCLAIFKNLVSPKKELQPFLNLPSAIHTHEIPQNSYSAEINIRSDIKEKRINLPQVYKINEVWSLTPESNIYFVERSGVKRTDEENKKGDIDKLEYHSLLSSGKIGVTSPKSSEETFKDDVIYHVVGFYIISKTSMWKPIQSLMRDFLRYRHFKEANELREELAKILEVYSATLSMHDQKVEVTNLTQENILDAFRAEVRSIQTRWVSILSSVGTY